MMSFEKMLAIVLHHEGGFSNHPADSGGATRYGITERMARAAGYQGDMRDLSIEWAEKIYRRYYWHPMRLDKIEDEDLKLLLFDTGVNMGTGTAGGLLQRSHNLLSVGKLAVDGIIGPITLEHVNNFNRQENLRYAFEILRGAKYLDIVKNDKRQQVFIHGWLNRLRDVAQK